jgi:Tol biopolymer transport system component
MLALSGSAFPIAGDVSVAPTVRSAPVSAAFDGPIVFRSGTEAGKRQFEWVDRNGSEIAKLGESIAEALSPSLSPDETSVVFHRLVSGNIDLWRLDTPFAVSAALEGDGQFSPDGQWIAYTSDESGRPEIYAARSRDPAVKLRISTTGGGMARWSRDGASSSTSGSTGD